MGIDFDGHRAACRIGFVFRILIDFAPQLVRLLAIHAPRLTAPFSRDFAQPFKNQHTAGIAIAFSQCASSADSGAGQALDQ